MGQNEFPIFHALRRYEEDAWVVAAKQIKAISPNITVIVWLDSFRICTYSECSQAILQFCW